MITLLNIDCMEYMAGLPDKAFDLAIVDPPYGIGKDGQKKTTGGNGGRKAHEFKGWDTTIPAPGYFSELFRVSTNQIIWGANYFTQYLPGSMGWIFWDKGQDINQSDGEFAFTSFNVAARRKVMNRVELLKEGTIHPTQKPVKLYSWLLDRYASPGMKIIDTHLGSGSSAIAAHLYGCGFVGCEIDKEYYDAAVKRFNLVTSQSRLNLSA